MSRLLSTSILFASAVLIGLCLGAPAAQAGSVPKRVVLESSFEAAGGNVDVALMARSIRTDIHVRTEGLTAPVSGEYAIVVRGASEDREVARFTVDETGKFDGAFRLLEDLRAFVFNAQGVKLVDGETVVAEGTADISTRLWLVARIRIGETIMKETYRLGGSVERLNDGRARFDLIARVERGVVGMLTFRLSGPDSSFDIPVEVGENGQGQARVTGEDDILAAAMQWTEVIVLNGDAEITRIPIACR